MGTSFDNCASLVDSNNDFAQIKGCRSELESGGVAMHDIVPVKERPTNQKQARSIA